MPRSNAHRLQIAWNCNSHFCSPVLDWTIRSGPNFLKTGLDCGLGVPDRTVRSFLQSPFPSDKKTGLYGPVSLKPDRTVVWGYWTVRSGLFQRSTKKATVRTGPDRGQSTQNYPMLAVACILLWAAEPSGAERDLGRERASLLGHRTP